MTENHSQTLAELDACVAGLEATLIKVRRHLHAHPEPSGEEVRTTEFLAQQLAELGWEPRVYRNGVGVSADVVLGQPSDETALIAVRSDMDALRMPDEKAVEYRSQYEGLNHACGHDAHAAMVLGLGLAGAAWRRRSETEALAGPVDGVRLRLIFQPAEETSQGARWLVEQGVLEGVSAILGIHVDPERLAGQVGIRYGALTANCDEVAFVVNGHGGHAARPHHTIDSVAAAAQLVGALYQFLPRSVDSRQPSVFTIGEIQGGYAPNVIPERVQLRGSLRTTDPHVRETLKRRIGDIVDGIEEVSGARVRYEFLNPLKAVYNDPQIAAALEEAAEQVVGKENVGKIDRPSMGGEDFSVYLDQVPGAMLRLGCSPPGVEPPLFLHSQKFDLDERVLSLGTRILLRAAVLLTDRLRPSPPSVQEQ